MTYLEIPEESSPRVRIDRVGSDLRLHGWERSAISAEGDQATIHQGEDGAYIIHGSGDLDVRLPGEASVTIGNVGSDAKITGLGGALQIGSVGSDLILRKTGPVSVEAVGSDLRIKRVTGDVTVGRVGADATVREVEGAVSIDQVGSDLYVRDLLGPCVVDAIGADLVLSTGFPPGSASRFSAGSDIVCRVPPETDARFRILGCADLTVDAPDAELIEEGAISEVVFGAGAALVELRAGADIRFVGQEEDYMMAINFQMEEDLEARLSGLEEKLAGQLAGLDDLIASSADRIRERAEREAERALRKTERAMRKAEKHLERGKHKRAFSFSFGGGAPRPPQPPQPPRPPRDPVTDDERLMILRMVENRQITVEEAEKLLAALEGR